MIRSFRHKGLQRFFETGSKPVIQSRMRQRLRLILGGLNAATKPEDMDLSGLKFHGLGGSRKGTWSVKVNDNWRITFQFSGTDAEAVNYEDYH